MMVATVLEREEDRGLRIKAAARKKARAGR
jgi:hypothetical protein